MEVISHLSPAVADSLTTTNPLNIMSPNNHSQQYLALGDVHTDSSVAHPPSAFDDSESLSTTPPPVIIQSRPAKKRKSWGQELPEPKTTLPPRKRAKTDDEKEQRRIERIKRNRAAAHNSRERKRQETETLAVALARANAELDAYRRLHGPLPASVVLPEVTLCTEDPETPAPSISDSRSSIGESAHSPITPPDTIFHMTDNVDIKQEPIDHLTPTMHLSPTFVKLDGKPSPAAYEHLDPTQHSAAMLCDLQCRSNQLSSTSSGRNAASSSTMTSWWTRLFLHIMTLQLQQCYRTLMLALWTTSPSRMAHLMRLSAIRSSRLMTSSTTPRLSRSTLGRLALSRTATGLSAPLQRGAIAPLRRDDVEASTARTVDCSSLQQIGEKQKALTEHGLASQSADGQDGQSSGMMASDLDGIVDSRR